jgi:L-threonine kinase
LTEIGKEKISKAGTGECYGSFGEILQGVLPGNKKFLINLKVKNKSRVEINFTSCKYSLEKEKNYIESYGKYSKSYKVLRNILTDIGYHYDIFINVDSNIPVGKGLSSSTADMVASIKALEQALSITLKKTYISKMISEIEPNDGLHYEGTCFYHHTTGELVNRFDFIPQVHILGIDFGGEFDTVKFNATSIDWSDHEMEEYAQILEDSEKAYAEEDVRKILDIATKSAMMWQKCICRPELNHLLKLKETTGALGVVNTHSGTYLGLVYEPGSVDITGIHALLQKEFPSYNIQWFQTATC